MTISHDGWMKLLSPEIVCFYLQLLGSKKWGKAAVFALCLCGFPKASGWPQQYVIQVAGLRWTFLYLIQQGSSGVFMFFIMNAFTSRQNEYCVSRADYEVSLLSKKGS